MRRLLPLALCAVLAACQADPPASAPAASAPSRARVFSVPTYTGDFSFVDDGADDPDFAAFRQRLQDVVVARDTAALLALVAPGARLSFDDAPGGPEGVQALWFSGSPPPGGTLWDRLAHALRGGSVAEDGAVTVPFVGGLWPPDADPFGAVALLQPDASAYDAPEGERVAYLSQIIVPVVAPPLDGWWQVRLPAGEPAFVAAADVYSPVGYRATFWDDGAGWRLQSFVAGD